MKIALIGATGNVGARLLAELRRRDHEVTAIARNPAAPEPGVTPAKGDVHDVPGLAKLLAGHDAAISAVMFHASDPAKLIAAVKAAGVPRYLVVGGAGGLSVAPGVRLIDTPEFPDAYRAEAEAGVVFLDRLKAEDGLDWTFLSPSAMFGPGERTGVFRLGTDDLLATDAGSSISYEDFAVAMVDEVENPAHARARFTVGY